MTMAEVIKRQLKTIKEQGQGILFFETLLNGICGGLLPFIGVIIPKLIIEALQASSNDQLLTYVTLFAVSSLLLGVIQIVLQNLVAPRLMALRFHEFLVMGQRSMLLKYEYYEDADFKDQMELWFKTLNSDGEGYQYTYQLLFMMLPLACSLLLYTILIGMFNIWVVLVCLLTSIVIVVLTNKVKLYQFNKRQEVEHAQRQYDYFLKTSSDFAYGKDIRLYSLAEKLLIDEKGKAASYLSVIKNIANHEFFQGLLQLLFLLLQDGVAYAIIINAYFSGQISIGDLAMYIGAVIAFNSSLRQLGLYYADLKKATNYTKDYYAFIDDKSYLEKNKGTLKALTGPLEIEFRNVSFKYPKTDKYIFKDFNFTIKAGEKLAIVGLNGAGKTTLVKLILGLFSPEQGEILINGIECSKFQKDEYAKMFGVVFQDVHIYAASVIENVMGVESEQNARQKAIKCLEMVGLKSKIESFPKQYDQPLLKIIADDGVELSGGQKQKLAIARALYKDANMVILDEPTSALDALAEAVIYQDFAQLVENKTAVYISHRLSSTKFCDQIALFSHQGLQEYGTHEQLMAQKGEYYHLFCVQGKYYRKGGENNE